MVAVGRTLRSIDDVVGMIGTTCEECERRLFSLPGVYDDVERVGSVAVFSCSRVDSAEHYARHRISFRTGEHDFERLSSKFGELGRTSDRTMRRHGIQALLKTLDIYAKFAENGLNYSLSFPGENGESLHAYVRDRTIDVDMSSPQVVGYILD